MHPLLARLLRSHCPEFRSLFSGSFLCSANSSLFHPFFYCSSASFWFLSFLLLLPSIHRGISDTITPLPERGNASLDAELSHFGFRFVRCLADVRFILPHAFFCFIPHILYISLNLSPCLLYTAMPWLTPLVPFCIIHSSSRCSKYIVASVVLCILRARILHISSAHWFATLCFLPFLSHFSSVFFNTLVFRKFLSFLFTAFAALSHYYLARVPAHNGIVNSINLSVFVVLHSACLCYWCCSLGTSSCSPLAI